MISVPKIAKFGLMALLLLIISGCGQRAAPTATLTPTASATLTRRPLPPTWTVGPSPTDAPPSATRSEVVAPALGSTALTGVPPSWTPAPVETVTPPPFVIPTIDPSLAALTPRSSGTAAGPTTTSDNKQPPLAPAIGVTFPADCATFTVDTAKTTRLLVANTRATLAWNKTAQADSYRVWVLHPTGQFVFSTITSDTQIVIPDKTFNALGPYGWELVAFHGSEPLCAHLTGVFVVNKLK